MSTTATMPKKRADPNNPEETLVPVTIRFPESLHARALKAARAEDRTFASLVLYALRRYVNEQEKQRDDA